MNNSHSITISLNEDSGMIHIETDADIKILGPALANAARADKGVLMSLSSIFALVSASLELATGRSVTKKSDSKKVKSRK